LLSVTVTKEGKEPLSLCFHEQKPIFSFLLKLQGSKALKLSLGLSVSSIKQRRKLLPFLCFLLRPVANALPKKRTAAKYLSLLSPTRPANREKKTPSLCLSRLHPLCYRRIKEGKRSKALSLSFINSLSLG
jgi:hypothetical protein